MQVITNWMFLKQRRRRWTKRNLFAFVCFITDLYFYYTHPFTDYRIHNKSVNLNKGQTSHAVAVQWQIAVSVKTFNPRLTRGRGGGIEPSALGSWFAIYRWHFCDSLISRRWSWRFCMSHVFSSTWLATELCNWRRPTTFEVIHFIVKSIFEHPSVYNDGNMIIDVKYGGNRTNRFDVYSIFL